MSSAKSVPYRTSQVYLITHPITIGVRANCLPFVCALFHLLLALYCVGTPKPVFLNLSRVPLPETLNTHDPCSTNKKLHLS